jgi:hypothetical protein
MSAAQAKPDPPWAGPRGRGSAVSGVDQRPSPPCPRCGRVGSVHAEGPAYDRVLMCACGWQAPLPTEDVQTCPLCGFDASVVGPSPGEVHCPVCWSLTQSFRVDRGIEDELRSLGVWADPARVRSLIRINGPTSVIDCHHVGDIVPLSAPARRPKASSENGGK